MILLYPLFLLFTFAALVSFANYKEALNTVYYDSKWNECSSAFATYNRIAAISSDENHGK